jgi:hypothetical protein
VTFPPRFVMDRTLPRSVARKALSAGRTVGEACLGGRVTYTPLRVKPRYWTSETLMGSVIHIATGRGYLTLGDVATAGQVTVEPYCNGRLTWPQALSSPDDLPSRRLCAMCVAKAHETDDIHQLQA